MSMSSELVPLSYGRDAYNVQHGTELKTHTDALTAEQAIRINNNYDIELYVGAHGLLPGAQTDNPYALLDLPAKQEYEAAAAVVDGMHPGDTLFLEGYGFRSQMLEPTVTPDRLSPTAERGTVSFLQEMLGEVALIMAHELKVDMRRRLEQERREYKINAWDYAQRLAALRGIRILYADHDAFERESLEMLSEGREIAGLMDSPREEDRALAERMNAQRERKARNMMKDWALEHLPPEDLPTANGRRPKLVLLFGGDHKEGLERTFKYIGLNVHVNVMKSTSAQGRAVEQVIRMLPQTGDLITGSRAGYDTAKNSLKDRVEREIRENGFQRGSSFRRGFRARKLGSGSSRDQGETQS